ncbi:unnamed protein product [Heligmosomoides polygyrus]|uniref:Alpha/beta hydrolase n=1 Tax=Heligmosomoides polygyrus TaxID=6339 RepID=A0A183FYE3_HELPZ|nr:unnamed protein product [Heligmosomoides polygyrus]
MPDYHPGHGHRDGGDPRNRFKFMRPGKLVLSPALF